VSPVGNGSLCQVLSPWYLTDNNAEKFVVASRDSKTIFGKKQCRSCLSWTRNKATQQSDSTRWSHIEHHFCSNPRLTFHRVAFE